MVGEQNSEMIFSDEKNHLFRFMGEELILGPIGPESKGYVREGMKQLSGESLRNRFFGGKKEFSSEELDRLTELDGKKRFALGVIRDLQADHGLGLIRMDRDGNNAQVAEVALTIIDEYQRRGLGTILLKVMILAALERGVSQLIFTYLYHNSGIEKLLGRFSPAHLIEKDKDSKTVSLDLSRWDIEGLRTELRPYLPEI